MEHIRMNVEKEYDIILSASLDEVVSYISSRIRKDRFFIVTDDTVFDLYGDFFTNAFKRSGITPITISVPHGENNKSDCGLQTIYSSLVSNCAGRDDVIVNFGGGMIGDLGGFAAATYMRGIDFINVPTTLLSMIDSSIGGKTAINFCDDATGYTVKNVIGAFHQPIGVCIFPAFLQTLPAFELKSGMGEVVKYIIIDGLSDFKKSFPNVDLKLIMNCCKIKRSYVEADPFDLGERKKLNLGHTYGHAFEAASSFTLSHGEAVGLGLIAVCDLGIRLGITTPSVRESIISLLAAAGLNVDYKQYMAEAVKFIDHDKKTIGKSIDMVLIRSIGDIFIESIPINTIKELLTNE